MMKFWASYTPLHASSLYDRIAKNNGLQLIETDVIWSISKNRYLIVHHNLEVANLNQIWESLRHWSSNKCFDYNNSMVKWILNFGPVRKRKKIPIGSMILSRVFEPYNLWHDKGQFRCPFRKCWNIPLFITAGNLKWPL